MGTFYFLCKVERGTHIHEFCLHVSRVFFYNQLISQIKLFYVASCNVHLSQGDERRKERRGYEYAPRITGIFL